MMCVFKWFTHHINQIFKWEKRNLNLRNYRSIETRYILQLKCSKDTSVKTTISWVLGFSQTLQKKICSNVLELLFS